MKKIFLTLSLFTMLSSCLSTTQVAYGENIEAYSDGTARQMRAGYLPASFSHYPPKRHRGRTLVYAEKLADNSYIGYYR